MSSKGNAKKRDMGVHYSSKSQTWNTPRDFFKPLNDIWKFTLDVACLPDSALCSKYFTPEDNSLIQDWGTEICWLNPPYNDLKTWLAKAVDAYNKGATVVILVPSRTDTIAFQSYAAKDCSCICFIKGRLKFFDPNKNENEKQDPAPFPSCLIVLDDNLTDEKIQHLKTLGLVMKNV
ncbi:methylase [Salmonella phage SE_PL]|nr:methylase [Salmonella phage 7t3]QIG62946.1 methylase [Salmonella phage SE_PL]WNV47196.1 methyltransferase [Klebsiella phage fENko-Kae01]